MSMDRLVQRVRRSGSLRRKPSPMLSDATRSGVIDGDFIVIDVVRLRVQNARCAMRGARCCEKLRGGCESKRNAMRSSEAYWLWPDAPPLEPSRPRPLPAVDVPRLDAPLVFLFGLDSPPRLEAGAALAAAAAEPPALSEEVRDGRRGGEDDGGGCCASVISSSAPSSLLFASPANGLVETESVAASSLFFY